MVEHMLRITRGTATSFNSNNTASSKADWIKRINHRIMKYEMCKMLANIFQFQDATVVKQTSSSYLVIETDFPSHLMAHVASYRISPCIALGAVYKLLFHPAC